MVGIREEAGVRAGEGVTLVGDCLSSSSLEDGGEPEEVVAPGEDGVDKGGVYAGSAVDDHPVAGLQGVEHRPAPRVRYHHLPLPLQVEHPVALCPPQHIHPLPDPDPIHSYLDLHRLQRGEGALPSPEQDVVFPRLGYGPLPLDRRPHLLGDLEYLTEIAGLIGGGLVGAVVKLDSKVAGGDAAGFGEGDLNGDRVVLAESAEGVVGAGRVVPGVSYKSVPDGADREAKYPQAGNEQCTHDG